MHLMDLTKSTTRTLVAFERVHTTHWTTQLVCYIISLNSTKLISMKGQTKSSFSLPILSECPIVSTIKEQ